MTAKDLHAIISELAANTGAFLTALIAIGFLLVIPASLIFNGTRGRRIQ